MTVDAREVEWRFDALDLRPVQRWLDEQTGGAGAEQMQVVAAGTVSRVDLYLDTEDQRFRRAGYALRIRRIGRRRVAEVTLEGLEPAPDGESGPHGASEFCEPPERDDPSWLPRPGGPVGERVRAVAGRKPLLRLFEVRTRRRLFRLEGSGFAPPAELALDQTAIQPANGAAMRLRRVEIELPVSALSEVGPFVAALRTACALQPANLSTYEAGLLAADLRPPLPERFGPTAIEADASIGALALAVLRRHFSVLLAKEPGTRLGDDVEELHDMRVASRRLRAALAVFEDVLPAGAVRLREELGWLGATLGAVRDLDVQLEQLDRWLTEVPQPDRDALAGLRLLLEQQRTLARASMIEALDSRRFEAFVSRFGRTLRARHQARSGPAALQALAVAPDLIEAHFRRFRKAGDRIGPKSAPSEYHRLRIRAKRLRYTLEFLAELYPQHEGTLIRRLVALQDLLGLHQDADVAVERLRQLAGEHGGDLQAETIFAMGEVAERYRQAAIELRARYPKAYKQVTGQGWRSFRKLVEANRPASSRTPTPITPDAPAPGD